MVLCLCRAAILSVVHGSEIWVGCFFGVVHIVSSRAEISHLAGHSVAGNQIIMIVWAVLPRSEAREELEGRGRRGHKIQRQETACSGLLEEEEEEVVG